MALKCGLTFIKLLHSRSTSQVFRSSHRGLLMIQCTHVKVRTTVLNQSTKTLEHLDFLVLHCTAWELEASACATDFIYMRWNLVRELHDLNMLLL